MHLLATTFLTLVLASALYAFYGHNGLFYSGIILLTVILILVWLTAQRIVALPMALNIPGYLFSILVFWFTLSRVISWQLAK